MTSEGKYSHELREVLARLSPAALRMVETRLSCRSEAETARRLGLDPSTIYTCAEIDDIRLAVSLCMRERIALHQERLTRLASRAIEVLESELDNPSPRGHRYDAAIAILDRVLGKPTERVQLQSDALAEVSRLVSTLRQRIPTVEESQRRKQAQIAAPDPEPALPPSGPAEQ